VCHRLPDSTTATDKSSKDQQIRVGALFSQKTSPFNQRGEGDLIKSRKRNLSLRRLPV